MHQPKTSIYVRICRSVAPHLLFLACEIPAQNKRFEGSLFMAEVTIHEEVINDYGVRSGVYRRMDNLKFILTVRRIR